MYLKIKAATPEYLRNVVGNRIRAGGWRNLTAEDTFGSRQNLNDGVIGCEDEYRRAYIEFYKPQFNHFLSRKGAFLRTLLGVGQEEHSAIMRFSKAYNPAIGRLQDVTQIPNEIACECRYGASIYEYYIDNFNIEEAIKYEFRKKIRDKYFVRSKPPYEDIGTVQRGSGLFKLLGDWWFTPCDPSFTSPEQFNLWLTSDLIKQSDERIVYLLNMTTPERMKGLLSYGAVVTPIGSRPVIDHMQDPATVKYSEIIAADRMVQEAFTAQCSAVEIAHRMRVLDARYRELTVEADNRNTKALTKSQYEKLKGKKGRFRDTLLHIREDTSGRAPVVTNPRLKLRQCGVPISMMPKLFRYHYMFRTNTASIADLHKMSDADMTQEIQRLGILDEVPVLINRQPSLHRLSYLAFLPIPSQSNAIEMHPLVCPGFNMDHDGDTAAIHVPIYPDAVREVMYLMRSDFNLYKGGDASPTVVPRMEMIYGLYVATDFNFKLGSPVASYTDYESLRHDVMMHRVKIYDTVTMNGKQMIAGYAAVLSCFPQRVQEEMCGAHIHYLNKKPICDEAKDLLKNYRGVPMPEFEGKPLQMNSKTIELYCKKTLQYAGREAYVEMIDLIVPLSYRLALLYTPTMDILDDPESEFLKHPFTEFHEKLKPYIRKRDLGWLAQRDYDMIYQKFYREVTERVEKEMKTAFKGNGYYTLVKTGARGNESNIQQIHVFKGQIQRSQSEAFNAVIENNARSQLTPLEHDIAACGSRKGLVDKVRMTAGTGYDSRLMVQAAIDTYITEEDCGTTDGTLFEKSYITEFLPGVDKGERYGETISVIASAIDGRYIAASDPALCGELDNEYQERVNTTEHAMLSAKAIYDKVQSPPLRTRYEEAQKAYNHAVADRDALPIIRGALAKTGGYISRGFTIPVIDDNGIEIEVGLTDYIAEHLDRVKIRTVFKCANPCCSKCYGRDETLCGPAVVGTPVGAIAGQSIGEPGTQLTMKTFQNGGVAGKATITSGTQRLEQFILAPEMKGKETYDPVAWASGEVHESLLKSGKKKITIGESKASIQLPAHVELKKYAVKGSGLCAEPGDHDYNELIKYAGLERAQMYAMLSMWFTYRSQVELCMKHFELLTNAMTLYVVIDKQGRDDLNTGCMYNRRELQFGCDMNSYHYRSVEEIAGVTLAPRIKGVKVLQLLKSQVGNNLLLENISNGASRAYMLDNTDYMVNQIPRIAFGLPITLGTGVNPNYIEDRLKAEHTGY